MAERRRVPSTDVEWIRRTEERLRVLENRRALVVGVPPNAYRLDVDLTGRLIATHTTTGTVTVVALP